MAVVINGSTGITVPSTAGAATFSGLVGYTSTPMSGGTKILTNTSSQYQVFTAGSFTHDIYLPVTSTLATGWTFQIVNNNTVGALAVYSSGIDFICLVPTSSTVVLTCIGTAGTTAADWEFGITNFGSVTGTGGAVLATSPTITAPIITGNLGAGGASYGTTGQVLVSGGAGASPSWASSQSIGVGQTWQDFTGSRSASTSYQNLTGRPISVQIRITASSSPFQVSIDNVTFVSIAAGTSTAGVGGWIGGIVPPNHYYRINGAATINGWSELR